MIASPQMCVPSGDGANGPKFTGKMDLARELLLLVVAEQVNAVQVRIVRRGEDNEKNFEILFILIFYLGVISPFETFSLMRRVPIVLLWKKRRDFRSSKCTKQ